jgi:hypothetical protein
MSGPELAAYSRSPGVYLNQPPDDAARARVQRLLNERDKAHDDHYGHLPGRAPGCTLPSRQSYENFLIEQERRSIIPDGCSTQEAQDLIRQRAPWAYIPDPSADPELEAARKDLARKIAALQVTR